MKKNLLYFILFLLFFNTGQLVSADTALLEISPSVISILAKPGSTSSNTFTLVNKGDPTMIRFNVYPFKPIDDNGHVKLEEKLPTDLSFALEGSSLKLNQPFLLKSNSRQTVNLTITTLEEVASKDYYFTLVADTLPFPAPEGETTLQFSGRVGANILLSVNAEGNLEKKASVALLAIPKKSSFFFDTIYDFFEQIPIVLILKNDGRNTIKPEVQITVKGFGLNKKHLFEPQNILASSQRLIVDQASCQDCSEDISMIVSGALIGKYTVSASINPGEGSKIIYQTTSFTVFPYKLAGALLIIVISIFFLRNKLNSHKK